MKRNKIFKKAPEASTNIKTCWDYIDPAELIDAMSQVQIESEEGRRWQEYFIRMVETRATRA